MKCVRGQQPDHDLNIQNYALNDVLNLFKLTIDDMVDIRHMKTAKRMVQRMHPDVSHMPSEYFLFYREAYKILERVHQACIRQHRDVAEFYTERQVADDCTDHDKRTSETHRMKMQSLRVTDKTRDKFQKEFNATFEEHIVLPEQLKRREDRASWFKNEDCDIRKSSGSLAANTREQMQIDIDSIRRPTNTMVSSTRKPGNVQTLAGSMSACLYDMDMDDEHANYNDDGVGGTFGGGGNGYVSCDPFGKLKFDDLRRVHKDETVFAVSARDLDQRTQYRSVEHLKQVQQQQDCTPLSEQECRRMIEERDRTNHAQTMQRQFADALQTKENYRRQTQAAAAFLRLNNN